MAPYPQVQTLDSAGWSSLDQAEIQGAVYSFSAEELVLTDMNKREEFEANVVDEVVLLSRRSHNSYVHSEGTTRSKTIKQHNQVKLC